MRIHPLASDMAEPENMPPSPPAIVLFEDENSSYDFPESYVEGKGEKTEEKGALEEGEIEVDNDSPPPSSSNENIVVKFIQKRPRARKPERAHKHSAAYDLFYAGNRRILIRPGEYSPALSLGFAMQMPEGYYALIVSRSGWAVKAGVEVVGAPAVIDQDFRGTVAVFLRNFGRRPRSIRPNAAIAQMLFCKNINADFQMVDKLDPSDRGIGGFGSTGKQCIRVSPL